MRKTSLARDTGWMFLGQGLGYVLRVVYFIVIARLLGVLQYGIVVGAFALVNLVAEQSRLGTGMVLLRYVSPNRNRFAVYWGNTLLVTLLMSGVFILILHFVAPFVLDPASAAIVVILAVASCFLEQLTISATQAFMAFQSVRMSAALNQLTSMFRSVAAVAMLVTLHHATAPQWAIGSLVASMLAAIVAMGAVSVRLGRPRFTPGLAFKHGIEGVEYAFASSTTNAYNDLDKAMLSHFGMMAENGIYGLAYRIIELCSAPLMSLVLAVQPRLFQLAETGPSEPILLGRRLLKHSLLLNTGIALVLFFTAPLAPLLVGPGFSQAVSAMRWLCLIPIFRSLHQITGSVLTSIGMQRYRTVTQILVVVLNFGLNLWLIPKHGWRGAAWASLATDGALGLLNWGVLETRGMDYSRMAKDKGQLLPGETIGYPSVSRPTVSIIIPYFNSPKFLLESVFSAQQQRYPNVEIIVVDDGSDIHADGLLSGFHDVVILRTENHGVSAARNLGFTRSSGEYLIFLDQDDRLVDGAIETHLQGFRHNPGAAMTFGATTVIDATGSTIRPARACRHRRDYFDMLLESNPIPSPGAAMIRRDAFEAAGHFDESLSSRGEDYYLYLRIARHHALVQIDAATLEYREHHSNASIDKEKMLLGTMAALDSIELQLSDAERRRLPHARRRWVHEFRSSSSLAHRIWGLYFSFRAMLRVPLRSYLKGTINKTAWPLTRTSQDCERI